MARADKAVLRLALGLGLAALIAYGFALTLPFVACILTVLLLCKPGPPIPFAKGIVLALDPSLLSADHEPDTPYPPAGCVGAAGADNGRLMLRCA